MTTRLWRVCKLANRPWPVMHPDPVIDYQIMEAVALKVQREDEAAATQAKADNWKKDTSSLDTYR